jgi:hypothetical protein
MLLLYYVCYTILVSTIAFAQLTQFETKQEKQLFDKLYGKGAENAQKHREDANEKLSIDSNESNSLLEEIHNYQNGEMIDTERENLNKLAMAQLETMKAMKKQMTKQPKKPSYRGLGHKNHRQ